MSDLRHFVHVTYGRGSVLLWWRSDTFLCTSGFMDDVAAQLKRIARTALGLAINCVQ